MWFRRKSAVQKSVNKLEADLREHRFHEYRRQLEQQLIILKDRQLYGGPPPMVAHEGIATLPGNMPASFNILQGYSDMLQIPAMIRNLWSYKNPVILTIVHQDWVRWIGRILYEQCPTAQGIVHTLAGLIYGSTGIQFKVFSREAGKNDDLVKRVQLFIDDVCEFNNMLEWQLEAHRRIHTEGEVFVLVTTDTRDQGDVNLPIISIIEPDYVRPSQTVAARMDHEDPNVSGTGHEDWSFGIHNQRWKYYAPQDYNVVWPDSTERVISRNDLFHYANKKARNVKRGVPSYFSIIDDLIGITILRIALREGAKARAAIAGVVQHETAPSDVVKSNIRDAATGSETRTGDSGTPYTVSTTDIIPGSFLHINKGCEFVEGPAFPDSQSLSLVYDQTLEMIANFYTLPASMLSGRGSQQSFAGSLVEENPGTKRRETEQASIAKFWKGIIKRCVTGETKLNLPEDVWKIIDIKASGPAIVSRDKLSETQEHETRVAAGVESKATWQASAGLDTEEEADQIADEQEEDAAEQTLVSSNGAGSNGDGDVKAPKTISGLRSRMER